MKVVDKQIQSRVFDAAQTDVDIVLQLHFQALTQCCSSLCTCWK